MNIRRSFYLSVALLAFLPLELVHSSPCYTDEGLKKRTCGDEYPSLFSDFDSKPRNATRLQGVLQNYYYAFDDHSSGGTTKILDGAAKYENYPYLYAPVWNENSGFNDTGYGLFLEFEIGNPLENNLSGSVKNPGFAGFGVHVYDSSSASYWNEKIEHFPYFYFDYLCNGDFQELTLEIHDFYEVSDAKEPNRQSLRGAGVVWHKHLPPTGTTWKHAIISLDSLTIHASSEGKSPLPLDRTRLSKFLFKVYGEKGEKGKIAIDNLYFGDGGKVKTTTPDVNTIVRKKITALNKNRIVYCKSNVPFDKTEIEANLYTLEGKRAFTGTFKLQSPYELTMQIPDIPAGRYLLCLKTDGKDSAIPVLINK